jgi:hypothetical protein
MKLSRIIVSAIFLMLCAMFVGAQDIKRIPQTIAVCFSKLNPFTKILGDATVARKFYCNCIAFRVRLIMNTPTM